MVIDLHTRWLASTVWTKDRLPSTFASDFIIQSKLFGGSARITNLRI
jgi:hypothetical protein